MKEIMIVTVFEYLILITINFCYFKKEPTRSSSNKRTTYFVPRLITLSVLQTSIPLLDKNIFSKEILSNNTKYETVERTGEMKMMMKF